jgi:hypothetical protein
MEIQHRYYRWVLQSFRKFVVCFGTLLVVLTKRLGRMTAAWQGMLKTPCFAKTTKRNRAAGPLDVETGKRARRRAILVTVVVMVLLVPFAILDLLARQRAANEGAAISSLKTIHSAEFIYKETVRDGNYGSLETWAPLTLLIWS